MIEDDQRSQNRNTKIGWGICIGVSILATIFIIVHFANVRTYNFFNNCALYSEQLLALKNDSTEVSKEFNDYVDSIYSSYKYRMGDESHFQHEAKYYNKIRIRNISGQNLATKLDAENIWKVNMFTLVHLFCEKASNKTSINQMNNFDIQLLKSIVACGRRENKPPSNQLLFTIIIVTISTVITAYVNLIRRSKNISFKI